MKRFRLNADSSTIRAWAPVFLWLCLVFFLSTRPAWYQRMQKVVLPILLPAQSQAPASRAVPRPAPAPTPSPAPAPDAGREASPASGPAVAPKPAQEPAAQPSAIRAAYTRAKQLLVRLLSKGRQFAARIILNGRVVEVLAHSSVYGVLGALLRRGQIMSVGRASPVPLIVGSAVVSSLDEGIQNFVPMRTPSTFDMAVDLTGVMLGILLFDGFAFALQRVRRSHVPKHPT